MIKVHDKLLQMGNNEVLLIESNVFFKELSDVCFFVVDDEDELNELKKVLNDIKTIDHNASIFCCTYGVDRSDDKVYIYCDNLWIDTFLSVEDLQFVFSKYDKENNSFRGIVPSYVKVLSEDEIINENIKYIIYDNGIINDYKKENEIIEISNTKSLLWDWMKIWYWPVKGFAAIKRRIE